jgi:PIN domain nuclease of toxin-antitoxin system
MNNDIFISHISFMELAIKKAIGKLSPDFPDTDEMITQCGQNGLRIPPISSSHIQAYRQVPLLPEHRDPFDRFLIAIAMSEKYAVVSSDEKFRRYDTLITLL